MNQNEMKDIKGLSKFLKELSEQRKSGKKPPKNIVSFHDIPVVFVDKNGREFFAFNIRGKVYLRRILKSGKLGKPKLAKAEKK